MTLVARDVSKDYWLVNIWDNFNGLLLAFGGKHEWEGVLYIHPKHCTNVRKCSRFTVLEKQFAVYNCFTYLRG